MADNSLASSLLNWTPQRNISDMCKDDGNGIEIILKDLKTNLFKIPLKILCIKNYRFLVTGSAGFIGAALVRRLWRVESLLLE